MVRQPVSSRPVHLWHLTTDAPRTPHRPSPGEPVVLRIGTWPVESGQSVTVAWRVERATGSREEGRTDATWVENRGANSFWQATLGPFQRGDRVRYQVEARSSQGVTSGPSAMFKVGPRVHLALLWHQHQPVYKNTRSASPRGSYTQPWVRMHALRDYVGMPLLVAERPSVHVTFNLTPCLLSQLDDLTEGGASDRLQELLLRDPAGLGSEERAEVLARAFDADPIHQIAANPRYAELFAMRETGAAFSDQDVRDALVWFSLAWCAKELREGEVTLPSGEKVSARRLVEKARGFDARDVEELAALEQALMRAVVPVHRALQDQGQIEVTTTPFYHPILPLLVDTDRATLDRPNAVLPTRFAWPEDAAAHVERAVADYKKRFSRRPRGMWPAEGAVAQSVVPLFADARLRWIATDAGVLARSGQHGYDVGDPDVLCRPYRAVEAGREVSIFFRDTRLSDDIGFAFKGQDPEDAARAFLASVEERAARFRTTDDRVLTVALDGENAWGGYAEDGRPFLRALYRALDESPSVQTVTFAEYLEGNEAAGVAPHPKGDQSRVYDLATASWIDEAGSHKGNDLGTWIGEQEENVAWELLGEARRFLAERGATPEDHPAAFEALYVAEGSDWFWWFGDDQDSGRDGDFDDLFRMHLANVYGALGAEVPASLTRPIVPHGIVWTYGAGGAWARVGDVITVRTAGPGLLRWTAGTSRGEARVVPAGGAMGHVDFHLAPVGPLGEGVTEVVFDFEPDGGAAAAAGTGPARVVRVLPSALA